MSGYSLVPRYLTDINGNILTDINGNRIFVGYDYVMDNFASASEELTQDVFAVKPGSTVLLSGNIEIPVYEYQLGTWRWHSVYAINSYEPVSDIEIKFNKDKAIDASISTGIESEIEVYDPEVVIAAEARESEVNASGVGYSSPVCLGVSVVTDNQSLVAPNATMSNGALARYFALAMPSVPMGATTLNFSFYANSNRATIETVQNPSLPTAGWIGKVIIDDAWNNQNSCIITGIFIFR